MLSLLNIYPLSVEYLNLSISKSGFSFIENYILDYMLRNIDFCKNRTELNKILTSLSKKKYIELDKGYKSTDIYLNIPKVSVIGGILGFIKKDHDEIYNIYQIQL